MSKKFGPTRDFPRGKLNESDDGGLQIGVATDDQDNVIINFGTKVQWIGMPPEDAINFAKLIMKHAGATKIEVTIG